MALPPRPRLGVALLTLFLWGLCFSPAKALADSWWPEFGPEGINGKIRAIAADGSTLVVGGDFTTIGSVPASHVARWNGSSWEPLGVGLAGSLHALTLYEGALVAAIAGSDLQRWDGSQWVPFAAGHPQGIEALVSWNGVLVAGGSFTSAGGMPAARLALWDGANWLPFPQGVDEAVHAFAVAGAGLFAAGSFTNAGGIPAQHIARWDGSSWSTLGAGLSGTVESVVSFQGNVIAGGSFPDAALGAPALHLVSWDGAQWSKISPAPNASVAALAVFENDLIAGGSFTWAGNVSAAHIARWNGVAWSSLDPAGGGSGIQGWTIFDLLSRADGIYAAGFFDWAANVPAVGIARWNGSSWSALPANGTIAPQSLVSLGNWSGDLVAGGNFHDGNSALAQKIAHWDGSEWNPLGSGINSYVWAHAEFAGQLTIGGAFSTSTGAAADHVAVWDGAQWKTLGVDPPSGPVFALQEFAGDLFAGGSFANAGGVPTSGIARWNGVEWSAIAGAGAIGTEFSEVTSLLVDGSTFIAAGEFTSIDGTPARSIARWNGSNWSAMGAGIEGHIQDVARIDGQIYAGGVPGIFAWDGDTWHSLDTNSDGPILALSSFGESLFVGGSFHSLGAQPSFLMARWDASAPTTGAAPFAAGSILSHPYPNPFRNEVTFTLRPFSGLGSAAIYDAAGREVRALSSSMAGDARTLQWDGRDRGGSPVAPGIYFLRLRTSLGTETRPIVRLR